MEEGAGQAGAHAQAGARAGGRAARRGGATLKDVARAAGVAWSTASNALNGGPKPVSADVRRRVHEAARELGYSSDLVARGLVTGRSRTLGVLAPNLESYIAVQQIAGIEAEARERNYRVLLAAHLTRPSLARLAQREMSARRIDGLIAVGATEDADPETVADLPAAGLPFVLTYHNPLGWGDADCALVDQRQGGALAAAHLAGERGRRRLAFVGPPDRGAARRRLEGFRSVAGAAAPVASAEGYSARNGEEAFAALLARLAAVGAPPPDGVVAASDSVAAGVLRAAAAAGLRAPDDLGVVGFDDLQIVCDATAPRLTSVRPPLFEIGRWAVRRLLARLEREGGAEDAPTPNTTAFACTLAVRDST